MKKLALVFCLALGGGCVGKDTTTEGDRDVNYQTLGAATEIRDSLAALRPLVASVPGVGTALDSIEAALTDVILNAEHHIAVHGGPQKPVPYSKEAADAARKRSTEERAGGGFWKTIGGALLAGVGLVLGIQRYGGPIIQAIPWLGKKAAPIMAKAQKWMAGSTGKALDEAVATVAVARKEEAFPEAKIKEIADKVQSSGFANTILMEAAHAAEKKLFGEKL